MSSPSRIVLAAFAVAAALVVACENPFAPKPEKGGGTEKPPAPPATTTEQLMDNLQRAMQDRDEKLYESLIDADFWFTETDCEGNLVFANGREEELRLMGGSRDESEPGIFDQYNETFDFRFTLITRSTELGPEYPDAYPGDPDGHPDEDWEVYYGRVEMLLVDEHGDGYRVDQKMTYKLRRGTDGLWRIVRWIDDPLAGVCGSAEKPVAPGVSWAALKTAVPGR
ncbi:MAG: hypothetical protein AB1505_03040 [Candidatus Latescibacterota bacterium]